MVLAVGNQHDDPAAGFFGIARKGQQRLFQRLAHGRTLDRDERGVDAAGERPGHAVVRRDGQLHLGLPGEDHQPHTVLPQSVEEFADGILGPFQPVGLEVFGQHRIGDVDGQHHFDALRLLFAEPGPELRPCGRQREQGESRAEKDEFQGDASGRNFGHQLAERGFASEAGQAAPTAAGRQPEEHDECGDGGQEPKVLGVGESEHGFRECV